MRQKATSCATLALPPPQPLLDPHEIFPSFLKLGPTFSRAVTSALTCRAEGSQVYWQSREDIYMKKCHILNSTSFFFYRADYRMSVKFSNGYNNILPDSNSSVIPPSLPQHYQWTCLYTATWLNWKVPKWTLLYHLHSYTRCHAQLRHDFKSIYNCTYFTIYMSSLQLQNKLRLTSVSFEFLLELKCWKLN